MRIAADAIPGSLIPMWFKPIKTGNYEVVCGQLCGLGHYGMKGMVVVDEPADYQTWLKERAELAGTQNARSEEHTSELQSRENLVCRLLLEKKKKKKKKIRKKT